MKKMLLSLFILLSFNALVSAQTIPTKKDPQKTGSTQNETKTAKTSDSDFQNKKAEEAKLKQEMKRKEMKEKAKNKEEEIKNSKP